MADPGERTDPAIDDARRLAGQRPLTFGAAVTVPAPEQTPSRISGYTGSR